MAFSYSKISTYTLCPAKYRYKYLLKLQGNDSGTAAERGTMIHEFAEKYVLRETDDLPSELIRWQKVLDKMREDEILCEVPLAVDSNFVPCDFDSPDAHLRGLLDNLQIKIDFAEIGDWKTGKVRDYSTQMKFYTLLVFLCYPEINRVATRIRFIDHHKSVPGTVFTRKDIPMLIDEWGKIIKRMSDSKIFSPNPSTMCNYCPYNKKSGGPCKW